MLEINLLAGITKRDIWVLGITFLIIFIKFYIFHIIGKTTGLSNLLMYYRAFRGRKKDLMLVRLYRENGNIDYFLGQKKGSDLVLVSTHKDLKQSSFILKSECIYKNEMNLNCIDYYEKDIDPRNWITGEIMTTSPIALQNIITNATKADLLTDGFQKFLQKWAGWIMLFIFGLISVLAFVIINQNQQIADLTIQLATTNIISQ